jgi:hypothetical protein
MTKLERILEEVKSLTPPDRERLLELLQGDPSVEGGVVPSLGARGLASWTESTRNEDWSEFYPAILSQ